MSTEANGAGGAQASGEVHEHRLANGLLVLLKVNRNAPVVNINVAYRVGSKYERPGLTGISHLLEHMMFKGSENYPTGEFDHRLKQVGADNNAYTWLDQTVYYETIATDKAGVSLALEADRMRSLILRDDELAFEMTVVRNELDQRDDSPFTLLYESLLGMAFTAHPYRIPTIGYKEDVEAITAADLKAHYDRFYHPDNAFIVAVGDFEPDAMLELIRSHFEALPARGLTPPRITPEPPQTGERRFTLRRAGQMDYIMAGWHIPETEHPDSYALVVLANILGSGRTSRLYRALVDTSLCSDAGAFASNFGYQDPFLFAVTGALSPGIDPAQVEPLFYAAIAQLAAAGPGGEEVARARKQARASFVYERDSLHAEANSLVEFELMSSWRDLAKYLPGIEAVTAADVQRVAAAYLTEDTRTVGIYRAIKPEAPADDDENEHEDDSDNGDYSLEVSTAAGRNAGARRFGLQGPRGSGVGAAGLERSAGPDPAGAAAGSAATASRATAAGSGAYADEFTLGNGLHVVVRANRANPTVSLAGLIPAGSVDDKDELGGLSNFGVEMLSSGSERLDKFALAELLEDNAIGLGFHQGREALNFSGRCLSEDLPLLLDAFAEQLLHSNFPEDEIGKTRTQIAADIIESDDETFERGAGAAREMLYGKTHPFARRIEGELPSLERIGRSELAAWRERMLRPDGSLLVLTGDIDADKARSLLESKLAGWHGAPQRSDGLLARSREWAASAGQRRAIRMADKSNVSLLWMAPGISRTDAGWLAAFVANFIFGGDFSSRVMERLRKQDGLTYGAYSRITSARAAGPLHVSAQVSPAKVEQAVAACEEELARFSTDGATEAELALARDYLTGNYPVRLSTNGAVAGALLDAVYLGRGVDYIRRYSELVRAVTLDEVNAAAQLFAPARMLLTAAGGLEPALSW